VASLFSSGNKGHGENVGFSLLFSFARFARVAVDYVGDGSVLENFGSGVPHIKEDLVERAVLKVSVDKVAELLGVAERGERPVDKADNFAEANF
jgi:hypothetical protein